MKEQEYWLKGLNLEKHPEGGYYSEIYKCSQRIGAGQLSGGYEGPRNLSTSIYFLLPSNEVSKFHRLESDELWYFHDGSSLTVFIIDEDGTLKEVKLGLDLEKGEVPQVVIPGKSIFGAAVNSPDSYTLAGCMVSPGFDFRDFELVPRAWLLEKYPDHREIILKLAE